jgi:hypothetical protein
MAVTCPNCGAQAIAGAIYCDDCGTDLRAVAPADMGKSSPAGIVCSSCQHENRPGAQFCEQCGSRLAAPPPSAGDTLIGVFIPPESSQLPVFQPPIAPASAVASAAASIAANAAAIPPANAAVSPVARLHISSANIAVDLPQDLPEIIVGREDVVSGVFPQVNLEPFGAQDAGVSRRHSRLTRLPGGWGVEDLGTVNGTYLNRQQLLPNQRAPLKQGDELRLGNMILIFYTE